MELSSGAWIEISWQRKSKGATFSCCHVPNTIFKSLLIHALALARVDRTNIEQQKMLANRLFRPDIVCENPDGASRIATHSGRQGAGADSEASEYVSVEGQIEGSDYMGAAEALMEHHEVKHAHAGLLDARSLLDYHVHTALALWNRKMINFKIKP